jgi:PDZ domain-containing secreted protein
MDKKKTNVIFLVEKTEGNLPCDVFAFFPKENYYSKDNIGYGGVTKENWQDMKVCYAHIGQHSSCHIAYANACKKATIEEYTPLKKELEGLGYNLNIK